MARLQCICGESMNTTMSPSKNIIHVFFKRDIEDVLRNECGVSLFDFETSYDGPHEYWFCPHCRRVHVVEKGPNGCVLSVYSESSDGSKMSLDGMEEIYVFSDTDICDAEEKSPDISLAEFINTVGADHVYSIDKQKKTVCKRVSENEGECVYLLRE